MKVLPRSIRQRVIYTMLLVVLLSGIGFLLVLNAVVRGSFSELEIISMERDARRVHAALDTSVVRLQSAAGDWARWTDTYEFLAGEHPDYPDENLDAGSLDVLGVDFIAFVTLDGKVYHIAALDPETREKIEPPKELVRFVEDFCATTHAIDAPDAAKAGYALLPAGPAAVVQVPVTRSDGSGPSDGMLVTGTFFAETEIATVAEMTALNAEILVPELGSDEFGRPEEIGRVYVTAGKSGIVGRSTLAGIDGMPALTFVVREPRPTMEKAGSTIYLVGLGMLGVVVLSTLTMVVGLDRMVNRRLTRLHDEVSKLPRHNVGERRVTVEGDDEITEIALAINHNFEGLAEAEAALKHAADHDYLTGLANRRRFEQDVEKALAEIDRKGGTLAWVLMDLDGFKSINDTRGHHCGDLVLTWFARLLVTEVRRYSTIARLGGDEFAILLPHSDEYDAAVVSDRLLTALTVQRCDTCDGESFAVNASVGIAVAPRDGTTVGELSRAADYAMYHTKIARVQDAVSDH